jgi:hypothetical protein
MKPSREAGSPAREPLSPAVCISTVIQSTPSPSRFQPGDGPARRASRTPRQRLRRRELAARAPGDLFRAIAQCATLKVFQSKMGRSC